MLQMKSRLEGSHRRVNKNQMSIGKRIRNEKGKNFLNFAPILQKGPQFPVALNTNNIGIGPVMNTPLSHSRDLDI